MWCIMACDVPSILGNNGPDGTNARKKEDKLAVVLAKLRDSGLHDKTFQPSIKYRPAGPKRSQRFSGHATVAAQQELHRMTN